jgi:hypothetical protein
LSKLKKERTALETALKELEGAAKKKEEEALTRGRELEAEVHSRVAEVMKSVPTLLSEVAVLKPFLGGGRGEPERRAATVYPSWKRTKTQLSTVKDLRPRALQAFKAAGVPVQTWQRLHSTFAARLMPVLCGARSMDALGAYAHVATSGRIITVQVTTALSEVGDVFGRVDSARRNFIPHPAGLIDVALAAQKSDGLMLVVLDGANRGATESYLLPLLRAALWRSGSVALFHPSAVAASDPYSSQARIEWPKNLLLAATLVEGPTSLPVSPDIWGESVLIQTDLDEAQTGSVQALPEVSEVDPESELLSPSKFEDGGASESFEDLLKSSSYREVANRFEGALRLVHTDAAILQREVANGIVLPFLASIADDEARASAVAEVQKILGAKNAQGFGEAVDAARRRLA